MNQRPSHDILTHKRMERDKVLSQSDVLISAIQAGLIPPSQTCGNPLEA